MLVPRLMLVGSMFAQVVRHEMSSHSPMRNEEIARPGCAYLVRIAAAAAGHAAGDRPFRAALRHRPVPPDGPVLDVLPRRR